MSSALKSLPKVPNEFFKFENNNLRTLKKWVKIALKNRIDVECFCSISLPIASTRWE